MMRLISLSVFCFWALGVAPTTAADWWPFGKKAPSAHEQAGVRTTADTPARPTPTTTAKKSKWWNPFAPKPKPANTYASPYSGVGSSYSNRKAPEKQGFFGSLFGGEQQPEKLHTIDDFMRLERPGP